MNYANLIQNITETIKTNGSQAITAQVLQDVLVDMVGELGQSGALFGGVIDTSFVPDSTNDAQVVYIAEGPGTYTNFNGLVVSAGEVAFFYFDGNAWVKASVDVLEVVNDLNSTATDKALSAAMGKQLGDSLTQALSDLQNVVSFTAEQTTKTILERNRARTNAGALSVDGVRMSNDYSLSYYDSAFTGTVNSSNTIVGSGSRFIAYRAVNKGEIYAVAAHNTNTNNYNIILWFAQTKPAIGSTGLVRQLVSKTGGQVSDTVIEWVAPANGWLAVEAQTTSGSYCSLYQRLRYDQIYNYASERVAVPKLASNQAIDANADSATFGQAVATSSSYFGVSDFIDISGSYCLQVPIIYNTSAVFQDKTYGGVFYDAAQNPISTFSVFSWSPGNTSGRSVVLVPSGAKYIRMTNFDGVYINVFRNYVQTYIDEIKLSKPSFSSFIPYKENYENYMAISDTQGAAIYGDYLVTWVTGNKLNMYDLNAKTLVQQITLPTFPNTRTHANTLSFGKQKYDNSDLFPCLYLCSGYTTAAGDPNSQVYVLRLAGALGSISATIVQTITLSFGTWTEYVVDPIKDVAWINGSGLATYICVAVPSVTGGNVTITTSSTIIDQFDTPKVRMGLSTSSSGQGRFFYHSRVYYVSGVPFYPGEGEDALYLVVDNTLTHCTESIVALKNFGLTAEPESCCVWNDDFYVVYPSFLVKLVQ